MAFQNMRVLGDLKKFWGSVFIVSALLPFVGNPNNDSQPYPLMSAVLFMLSCLIKCGKIKITRQLIWYGIWTGLGAIFAVSIDGEITHLSARAIFGYIAIFVYYIAFENYLIRYGFPTKLVFIVVFVWLLVAIAQIYDPDVMINFVAHRTTSGRGLTSLAPEPTYFAVFLFFVAWLVMISSDYHMSLKYVLFYLLCVFGCIILAKSSMMIVYACVSLLVYGLYLFLNDRKKILPACAILLLSVIFLILIPLEDSSRLSSFLVAIGEGNLRIFIEDASSNQRLSSIVIPAISLFNNLLLPGGFNQYVADGTQVATELGSFFPYEITDKIMSWNLAMFYELGAFGLLAWISFFRVNQVPLKTTLEVLLLGLLLFSAIPHLFPLPVMILVSIRYKHDQLQNFKIINLNKLCV